MSKDKACMPKKEFVKEHKRLVQTLESGSKKEQKKEAKDQATELKEETKKAAYPTSGKQMGCGTGLSGKICRHNVSRTNQTKFVKKFKKSIDFQHTKSAIDSKDQHLAEGTTSPALIQYLETGVEGELSKIPFQKGVLTLSKKEPGLYNGFFQDSQGQVVEKFDSQTIAIIAKNMELKSLAEMPYHDANPSDEVEDRKIAQEEAVKVAEVAHQRIDMVHNRIDQIENQKGKSLKVRFGDFELELRKSVKNFVDSFKRGYSDSNLDLKKAVHCWRKSMSKSLHLDSDESAARELLQNWDKYKEGFNQITFALEQMKNNE